jgi:hypothetical protein
MEENGPSPSWGRNQTKKIGMVGAYIAETSRRCKPNDSWMESTTFKAKRTTEEVSSNGCQSCRSELERGEGGSEEQSSVAVCGGCPTLQIGVTGNIHWLTVCYLAVYSTVTTNCTVCTTYLTISNCVFCAVSAFTLWVSYISAVNHFPKQLIFVARCFLRGRNWWLMYSLHSVHEINSYRVSHTRTLILCSDVTTIVGLSLTPLFPFCGAGITEQRKWKWEGGGIEKLAWGIGRATKSTLKSDVDPSGNILFWSDPLLGGLS